LHCKVSSTTILCAVYRDEVVGSDI